MHVTVEIPDEIARFIEADGDSVQSFLQQRLASDLGIEADVGDASRSAELNAKLEKIRAIQALPRNNFRELAHEGHRY